MDIDTLRTVARAETVQGGLPNAHYIDAETYEIERKALLFANWAGIGFGKDVPEPGDAFPVTFQGIPLLILRDEAGAIAVFQNTCRHRGMILVDTPQKIRGAIRCPYHSWSYALSGALRTAPHVGGIGVHRHEDVNFDTLGLIRIRSWVWRDVIFVNIDGKAAPFEEKHADLLERWSDFDQPIHHGGPTSSFTLEVATNWKLAVENFCESYHLPWVHPELNETSRLEDHYNISVPGAYAGQGSSLYRQFTGPDGATFADFAGLGATWETGAEYVALFPNVLFGVQRDQCFAIVLEPQGCARTLEHVALYYAVPPDAAPDQAGMRDANARVWKTVFEEDVFVVEGMQRGRHGLFFDGGVFSPVMDAPTRCFHQWAAQSLVDSAG